MLSHLLSILLRAQSSCTYVLLGEVGWKEGGKKSTGVEVELMKESCRLFHNQYFMF
jgi:hypothetical protein